MHAVKRLSPFLPFSQCLFISHARSTQILISRRNNHIKAEDAKEITVPLPYGQIAGKEWGNLKGYPILCLHGLADNCDSFAPLAPLLSDMFHYIALDAPGHGLTSHPPLGSMLNYWDLVVHVRRVVNHFGFKKLSFLGHSMGGSTAIHYASLYPDSVDRILTLDIVKPITVPLAWHSQSMPEAIHAFLDWEKKTCDPKFQPKTYTLDELVNRYVEAMGETISPEAVRILLNRGAKAVGNGFIYSHDPRMMLPTIMRYGVEEQRKLVKGNLRCHLKIIKARQGPLYEDAALLEEFKAYYKEQCLSYEYDDSIDGTHHFHMHHPERVAPVINEYFARLLAQLTS